MRGEIVPITTVSIMTSAFRGRPVSTSRVSPLILIPPPLVTIRHSLKTPLFKVRTSQSDSLPIDDEKKQKTTGCHHV